MKTIEEIRKSVLTYCEEVCPFEYNKRHLGIGLLERASLDSVFYWLHVHGLSTIAIHENATDDHIFAAYRLLGLAERDAVAELKQHHKENLETLGGEIIRQEERNTALVAAIKEVIHHGGYFYANGDGEHHGHGGEKVLNVVGKILTSAIEANTEKGGVQG